MRKIREVLRLRFELGLGQRAIGRACSISQSTVHEYLNRAAAAGVVWPLGEEWDEQRVEQALFGERQVVKRLPEQVLPDFSALHSQLQQHRHLTLQLAWEEYPQIHPEGYGYSRFCELYQRWRRKQDVVLRQVHQPGEKGFVDWAGATIPVHDPVTGEVWPASLFVMVLGTSSYTYAEATRDQQLSAWISAHIHAFEYFSGAPRLLVPDNLRTGVSRACRYDPDVNPHLPRVCDALRRGSRAGAPSSSERQGQGRSRCASCRTLDHRRPTPPEVFSVGGSEQGDSRTAWAAEPATIPEARRIACQCVRCG